MKTVEELESELQRWKLLEPLYDKTYNATCIHHSHAERANIKCPICLASEVGRLKEAVHLANGTADLALKHRDEAEKEVLQLRADIAVKDLALKTDSVTRDDCERWGINFKKHECGCEVCYRSTELCPATQSSIIMEIRTKALSTSPGSTLLSELAELRKDKERLDWLEKQFVTNTLEILGEPGNVFICQRDNDKDLTEDAATIRKAIDTSL